MGGKEFIHGIRRQTLLHGSRG